jgi:hypothetical protein
MGRCWLGGLLGGLGLKQRSGFWGLFRRKRVKPFNHPQCIGLVGAEAVLGGAVETTWQV